MALRSLRLRLLASAAAAIFLALALAGFGLNFLFERHIERREALSMEAKARELLGVLRLDGSGKPFVDTLPSDNRFNEPAGGLYWQVTTAAGQEHSPSLWDQSLPPAMETPRDHWRVRRIPGPFEQGLLVIERMVRPDQSGRPVLVQVATDDGALLDAQREFGREMIGSLMLLWLVLIGAAYGQVMLGLKPLARIRAELDRMRRNPGARLSAGHPTEIDPLANAINSLADARAGDVDRARRRAADLAHSLKTPLAALAAQSRRAREAGAHEAADGLDRAIAAAGAALEAELARSRSAVAREAQASERANVLDAAEAVAARASAMPGPSSPTLIRTSSPATTPETATRRRAKRAAFSISAPRISARSEAANGNSSSSATSISNTMRSPGPQRRVSITSCQRFGNSLV